MNPARPDRPQDQPHDKDLSQLYRDAARAEPPAALDRQIIAAAQAEAARPRRRPWWRSWLAPVTAFATVVLTFTLTLLVHQEREREEAQPRSEQHTPVAPAQAPAAVPAAPTAPTMKQDRVDTPRPAEPAPVPQRLERGERTPRPSDLSSIPPRESERRRADAPAAPPVGKAMPEAFPGAMKEEAAAPVQSRSQEASPAPVAPASGDSLPVPPPPAAVAPAAPRPAPFPQPAPAAEAKRKAAPAAGTATGAAAELSRMRNGRAAPLEDKALRAAEDWLEEIRALKRQGREGEAQEALAQFRRAYPDYALPDDLR